jgi:hypothetical protein
METLNAWLAEECRAPGPTINHPEWPALKVADVLQDEQMRLMPNPGRSTATSSSRCASQHGAGALPAQPLQRAHRARPRGGQPAGCTRTAWSWWPTAQVVARHARSFERTRPSTTGATTSSLIERKPGALRNGAPFETMPEPLKKLQRHPAAPRAGGDRVMAQVLAAVPVHGLEPCWWPWSWPWRAVGPAASMCSTCWRG